MTLRKESRDLANTKDDFYEQLTKNESDELIRILKRSTFKRTTEDVIHIMKATENFLFFRNYIVKEKYADSEIHKKCCKNMTYEFHPKLTSIFSEGDQGNKLYFVLSGRLRLYVRMTPEEIAQKKPAKEIKKQDSKTSFLNPASITNVQVSQNIHRLKVKINTMKAFMTRHSVSAQRSGRMSSMDIVPRQSLKNEHTMLQSQPTKILRQSDSQIASQNISRQRSSMANVFKTEVDFFPGEQNSRQTVNEETEEGEENEEEDVGLKNLSGMKCLGTLEPGQIFGEIALTTGSRRKETVIAMEDCHLAVLSKEDFDRLLLPFQKSGLKKRIEFIEMAFGLSLSWDKAVALTYVFKKVKVCKGQFVFKENEQCNGFYIIKSGDILVSKEIEYTPPQKEKTGFLVEEMEKLAREETPFRQRSKSPNKKGKYQVQILSRGDFFGEEVLLQYTNRLFDAECKSDMAILYHVEGNHVATFLHHMKQYMDTILQQVHQRMDWRDKRLSESSKYVDKVLKASRNLDARTKSTPLMLRTFALDVPTTIAIMNNESTRQPSDAAKAYNSGGSNRRDPLSSRTSAQKSIKANGLQNLGQDTRTLLQQRSKRNNRTFSKDGRSQDNPFEMKDVLMVNPDEDGLPARRIKLMMRAREPKITNVWPNHKPLTDRKAFRETVNRVGPKLKSIMEGDLRIMVWGDKEQEAFREKLTRSMSCEKIVSAVSQVEMQSMNIQGLEVTGEKSFRNKKNDSFMMLETSRMTKKMMESQDGYFDARMRSTERARNKPNSGLSLLSRASVGCVSYRDLSSQWYESGGEDKVKIDKGTADLSRSKVDNESVSLLKVLDIVQSNAEVKQKKIINKLKSSVTRRKNDIEESYGEARSSRGVEVKDKGPYLKAFAKKSASAEKQKVKALNIGIPVDSKRVVVTSTTEEDLSDIKIEGTREVIKLKEKERVSEKYRSRERESEENSKREHSRDSMDGSRKAFGEWNNENMMRVSKHNMFRFKAKKSSRSLEREETLMRKSLL